MRLTIRAAVLSVLLFLLPPAFAQTAVPAPSPEALAAARELITTMRLTEQFEKLFPVIMQSLKPAIVQNRPAVEKDFDLLMPIMLNAANARSGELIDAMAIIYANALTVSELHDVNTFYKTPLLTQQGMAAGQAWGRSVGAGLRDKMIEELRKRGHII